MHVLFSLKLGKVFRDHAYMQEPTSMTFAVEMEAIYTNGLCFL